jgi:outer membrane lipoprotein SlyB
MMKKHFLTVLVCSAILFSPLGVLRAEDEHEDEDCRDCGVVTAVQPVEKGASGMGAAAGALAGGLLGNQVGKTDAASSTVGGTAATLLGVAGGALGGHYAEKTMSGSNGWNVTVKMDNGSSRTVAMQTEPSVQPGQRVRVSGDKVVPYKGGHDEEKED